MDGTHSGSRLTGQGIGPPEPVGSGSERAGSARPSSSDCYASLAGDQAGMLDKATGRKEIGALNWLEALTGGEKEEEVFRRRSSLPRTPPKDLDPVVVEAMVFSKGNGDEEEKGRDIRDITDDLRTITRTRTGSSGVDDPKRSTRIRTGSFGGGIKRLREEEPDGSAREIRGIMEKITATASALMNLVKTNVTTKVEIKNAVKELRWQVGCMNQSFKDWDEISIKTKNRIVTKETRTIGIQTDDKDSENEGDKVRNKIVKDVNKALNASDDFGSLTKVIDMEWPEETYKVTDIEKRNLHNFENESDIAVFLDSKIKNGDTGLEVLKKRIPAVTTLVEDGLTEGQIEYVRIQTEVTSSKRHREMINDKIKYYNTIYALPLNIDNNGMDDVEAIYGLCKKLKEELIGNNTERIKMIYIGNMNTDYLRKCAEHAFYNTKCKITLTDISNRIGAKQRTENNRNKGTKTENIVVRAEGRSYAELLKTMKKSIDIDRMGIKIETLKKTNRGDLLMKVRGGREKAIALKEEIKKNTENVQVIVRSGDEIVHIGDIDAGIEEEELKQEIRNNYNDLQENQVKILSLRPTINGNQAATVTIRRDIAADLAQKGKIKIGWVFCRVRKRVNIIRCFRCLQFGHRMAECTGEDKTDMCLKCGELGHKAKDCGNSPYCITCGTGGHRADQTKCPIYRKLVNEGAKRRPNVRGSAKDGN